MPWSAGRNAAGFLADLVLELEWRVDRDLRRAANLVVRLARERKLRQWQVRNAAQKLGRLLGQPLPVAQLDVPWDGSVDLPAHVKYTLTAATTLLLFPTRLRASDALIEYVVGGMQRAGVNTDDVEVRWRVRDWVGKAPVPANVRQAASAAWMIKHFALARQMVEGYVDDWLKEPS